MSATDRSGKQLHARLFRALLTLYPSQFRNEYGREMALIFADSLPGYEKRMGAGRSLAGSIGRCI